MKAGNRWGVPARRRPVCEAGFTYMGLMAAIAIMGFVLASTGVVWHVVLKREKEQELLFVGDQFRRAISQFYLESQFNARRYPRSLEELLRDPRSPTTKRYLRKIYNDPITGDSKWGMVAGPDGQILGIYSLSKEEPVKKGNFSKADASFEGRKKYSEWVFMGAPGRTAGSP